MSSIAKLDKIDPEIIADFRATGRSMALAVEMQKYIMHIDYAAQVYNFEGNITRCARMLQDKFADEKLGFQTARARIYDALNYFHLNNTVKNEAWDNYYADRLENLAKIAIAANNFMEARRCFEKAHDFRTARDENMIDPELLKPPVFLISNDITAIDMGFEKTDLRKIARKHNDGKYIEIIESLPIDKTDKEKLKKDANVTDVEYEDVS